MPSSSDFSDLRLERIMAREDHHRRNGSPSSDSKKSVDCTDLLDAIGRQFPFPTKQESWPKSLDITDDEATSRGSDLTPKNTKTTLSPVLDQTDSPPSGSASTPARTPTPTPTQGGAYLPSSEIPEFRRQWSARHTPRNRSGQPSEASPTRTRQPSPGTTGEHSAHEEHAPGPRSRAHTEFSIGHTPSHRSTGTVDEDNRSVGEGPRSPLPWSGCMNDPRYGRTAGSHKE